MLPNKEPIIPPKPDDKSKIIPIIAITGILIFVVIVLYIFKKKLTKSKDMGTQD